MTEQISNERLDDEVARELRNYANVLTNIGASRSEHIERIKALAARQSLRSVNGIEPVGDWVVVPREPTQAMIDAGREVQRGANAPQRRAIWRAMIAAAPQPAKGVVISRAFDPHTAHLFATPQNEKATEQSSGGEGVTKADAAMRLIWAEWFAFYERHFRAKNVAISMADQMAFYEIAQPVLRSLSSLQSVTDTLASGDDAQ